MSHLHRLVGFPDIGLYDRSRRRWMAGALCAGFAGPWSSLVLGGQAAQDDARLVVVILRGGMDGLWAVPAVGDPDFAAARGALARFDTPPLMLDGRFALHPHLAQMHAMYGRGEMSVIHAIGLPYRQRSHFDAQQVLESGAAQPYAISTGWLGRALAAGANKGIALETAVPLVLRGARDVDTWAPSRLPDPSSDLVDRIERMYGRDAALATALARARALHIDPAMREAMDDPVGGDARGFALLAARAAEFLSKPGGPKVAVLELGGWDSHANQTLARGPLAASLRSLDGGMASLREGLVAGGAWSRCAIAVVTEFGRTVAINGTQGTDHGSGGAAFVLGGAVRGGRVVADWPGLGAKDRFEGRDLRATTDMRALFKGLLADHLQLTRRALDEEVFPQSSAVRELRVLA